MDGGCFDDLTRELGVGTTSRRRVLGALAGGALGAVLGAVGLKDAAARHTGCRHIGRPCTRDGQCCTKRCRRGACRCPVGTTRVGDGSTNTCSATGGVCPSGSNTCSGTLVLCNDAGTCGCLRNGEGGSFCGDFATSVCAACANDQACDAITGVGSQCVPIKNDNGCNCSNFSSTACVPPCGTGTAAAASTDQVRVRVAGQ